MDIRIILGILYLLTIIVEMILSATWNKLYFFHGIRIFSKEFEISNSMKTSQNVKNIINDLDKIKGFSFYKGIEIDDNNYAFRKKMFYISYHKNDFENIHGTIQIDPEKKRIKISGYARYTLLMFMFYLIVYYIFDSKFTSVTTIIIGCIGIFAIPLSICYLFDYLKYKKLTEEITKIIK